MDIWKSKGVAFGGDVALAYPNHMRDMEMSTSTVYSSLLRNCRTTPDVTFGTVVNVYLDTLGCIPEEGLGGLGPLTMMAHNQQFVVVIRICECC